MAKVSASRFDRIGEKRREQVGSLSLGESVVFQPPKGKKLEGGPYIPAPGYGFVDSKGERYNCEKVWLFTWTSKMSCPSFSLPAGPMRYGGTCPAAEVEAEHISPNQTRICTACYAGKNLYLLGTAVIALSLARYEWVKREMARGAFADQMIRAIRFLLQAGPLRRSGETIEGVMAKALVSNRYFRIHDAGDMFSPAYYREWVRIAEGVPEVKFWAPVRVWALKNFQNVLLSTPLPSNLIVRPSSLYTDQTPPEMPEPMAAGSTSFKGQRIKEGSHVVRVDYPLDLDPRDHGIYDCPAFLGDDEHSCIAAGCRKCWDSRRTPISYLLH